jgi:hypothetical protein
VLTAILFLIFSFIAGASLAAVGLPRLKRRSSRLERPG